MQDIVKVCKFINHDKDDLKKKKISKHKHSNQYTLKKVGKQAPQLKQMEFIFKAFIPPLIRKTAIYRVNEDVFLPSGAPHKDSLGCLSINPISNQYKVVRIDKQKNLISFSLEVLDIDRILFNQLVNLIQESNPKLAQFLQTRLQKYKESLSQRKFSQIEEIAALHDIALPFECHIQKCQANKIIMTQKIVNNLFLQLMGITEKMLMHYIKDVGYQPTPVYSDQCDVNYHEFTERFDSWQKNTNNQIQFINYQGQRFYGNSMHKSLQVYCQAQQEVYRLSFWFYEVDKRWIAERICKNNEIDYFNKLSSTENTEEYEICEESFPLSPFAQRCGFKELNQQQS